MTPAPIARRLLMPLLMAALVGGLAIASSPAPVAQASGSISLDEPFTGATLNDPSKWISMQGGSHPEWPCLTAASTSTSASVGTVQACVNQGATNSASVGSGALRLTRYRLPEQNWTAAGSLLYTASLSATQGIDISFSIRMDEGRVADGMSFFLKDGINNTNTVGMAGGALGYGLFNGGTGVPGALFGVGFDRYGNFSSEGVASAAGCSVRGTHPSTSPRDPEDKNKLVLRGPDTSNAKDGSAGYCYLAGEQVAFSATAFQRVRVVVPPYTPGSPTTVSVYLAAISSPTIVPSTPTLTETITINATSFKFGFSAASGFWSNNHDLRGLLIRPAGPAVASVTTSASTGSGTGPTSGGTLLTITGTGIDPNATVTVDGQACTGVSVTGGGTQLTCTTPAGSLGPKQVVVTNANGGPGYGTFTYVSPPPTVTAVSPNSGLPAGGNTVTVSGTGFIAGATVTMGGQACTSVNVVSSSALTCQVPSGTDGAVVDVVVTNPGPTSGTGAQLYTYRSAAQTPTPVFVVPPGSTTPSTTTPPTTSAPSTTQPPETVPPVPSVPTLPVTGRDSFAWIAALLVVIGVLARRVSRRMPLD